MPISSLNWQAAHAWLLAHEGYWVLGTVALFVVGLVLLGRPKPEKPWRVRSRPLLTENELEFCHRLEDALPEFRVMVQVSMGWTRKTMPSRGASCPSVAALPRRWWILRSSMTSIGSWRWWSWMTARTMPTGMPSATA